MSYRIQQIQFILDPNKKEKFILRKHNLEKTRIGECNSEEIQNIP